MWVNRKAYSSAFQPAESLTWLGPPESNDHLKELLLNAWIALGLHPAALGPYANEVTLQDFCLIGEVAPRSNQWGSGAARAPSFHWQAQHAKAHSQSIKDLSSLRGPSLAPVSRNTGFVPAARASSCVICSWPSVRMRSSTSSVPRDHRARRRPAQHPGGRAVTTPKALF